MSKFKVIPISKRYDYSDHGGGDGNDDDEIYSEASSSIHSAIEEKVDDKKNKETSAHSSDNAASASATVAIKPSKFTQSRNKLKDDVLAEVMSNIMPDIGAYDLDGMADRNNTESNRCVRILKFLGILCQELHQAVLSGSLSQVRRSIGKFSNPKDLKNYNPALINQYDTEGRTPLSLAVKIKHFEMVDLLLEHKALPEIIDEASGRTPLMFSVLLRSIKITTLLIKKGASVNFPDFKFMTALMIAAANKDIAHVQLLCKHLADVDSQDDNGWTPLHYAVMSNSTECVKFILQEGADREIRDYQKRRPLDLAKSKDHDIEIIRDNIASSIDLFRDAYVYDSLNTAVAVGFSESFAGGISAVASRGIANVIGDVKVDSLKTKISSTSAFFGTRSLIITGFSVLGAPRPIAVLLASLIASIISEVFKFIGRSSDHIIDGVGDGDEKLDVPEIMGDITKWVSYVVCYDAYNTGDDIIKQVLLSFFYGGLSGFLGLLISDYIISAGNKENNAGLINNNTIVADLKSIDNDALNQYVMTASVDVTIYGDEDAVADRSIPTQQDIPRIINSKVVINVKNDDDDDDDIFKNNSIIIHQHQKINHHEHYSHDNNHHHHDSKEEVSIHSMKSYQQHMLEGGILFATFEIVAYLLQIIVPEQFNLKFSFNQFLQIVEKDLNPTITIDL